MLKKVVNSGTDCQPCQIGTKSQKGCPRIFRKHPPTQSATRKIASILRTSPFVQKKNRPPPIRRLTGLENDRMSAKYPHPA